MKHHLRKLDRAVKAVDVLVRLFACRLQLAAGLVGHFVVGEIATLGRQPVRPMAGDLAGAQEFGMRRDRGCRLIQSRFAFRVEVTEFRHVSHSACRLIREKDRQSCLTPMLSSRPWQQPE
jgi:hypothetical protein